MLQVTQEWACVVLNTTVQRAVYEFSAASWYQDCWRDVHRQRKIRGYPSHCGSGWRANAGLAWHWILFDVLLSRQHTSGFSSADTVSLALWQLLHAAPKCFNHHQDRVQLYKKWQISFVQVHSAVLSFHLHEETRKRNNCDSNEWSQKEGLCPTSPRMWCYQIWCQKHLLFFFCWKKRSPGQPRTLIARSSGWAILFSLLQNFSVKTTAVHVFAPFSSLESKTLCAGLSWWASTPSCMPTVLDVVPAKTFVSRLCVKRMQL